MPRRVLLLSTLLLAVTTGAANAAPRKVPYLDASGYPAAVKVAVAQWNRVQTGLKLVPTTDVAKVVIPIGSKDSLGGHNTLGGALGVLVDRTAFDAFSLPQQATLISHAIGHALRLDDRKRNACAVMSAQVHDATLDPGCRPPTAAIGSGLWRCGPNTGDARAVVRRYGGRVRPSSGFCRLPPDALDAAVTGQRFDGALNAVVTVGSAGTTPLRAGDLGLLTGGAYLPLDAALAPGAQGTITYPACPLPAQGQLYSPTFDTLLGAPLTVAAPACR